jgi:hypothetical protein
MITVTDIHTGERATINTYDFTDTVTSWFPEAPAEVLEGIAEVQDALNRGQFTSSSAVDSLGLEITTAEFGERVLWNDGSNDGVLDAGEREEYGRALDAGECMRRVAADAEVTSDTLTVDLILYTDPVTGLVRFAVRHEDPSISIAWDYPTRKDADARFDEHVSRLTDESDIDFADDEDDEDETGDAPQVTEHHVRDLLDSPAEEPVLYVEYDGEIAVGPRIYASHRSIVITREGLVDWLALGGDETTITADVIADYLPQLQESVDKRWAERS